MVIFVLHKSTGFLRYFIELAYNGRDYHGWQIQPRERSVQEEIENALSTLLKEEIKVTGCGRTDTGVHAEQFYLHFEPGRRIDREQFIHRLNSFLPGDIVVFDLIEVTQDGHARFSAVSRTYEYRIFLGKHVFCRDEICQLPLKGLDVKSMNQAGEILLKHKDFKCFSRSKTDVSTYECDISMASWKANGQHLTFRITANRFLRNMVRAIVGTMIEVGLGKMTLEQFEKIVLSRDRTKAGPSAKAHGLFLTQVHYPDDIFINSIE